jgi:hypothetical protein
VPGGGTAKLSVAAYTAGAKPVPGAHWVDRVHTGFNQLVVYVDRVVVGPKGWAVTVRIENQFGPGDVPLQIEKGIGTAPAQAGFSLQFVTKSKVGGNVYTALPALSTSIALPTQLSVSQTLPITFAGTGDLPHDGTMISIGLGVFSSAAAPRPTTVVTNTSFKLH